MKVKLLKEYPPIIVNVEKYKPDFATYIDPQIWQYPLEAGYYHSYVDGRSGGNLVHTVHQKDFKIL